MNKLIKVQVYYNLHKHCWSIKDVKLGRVIDHRTNLVLTDCVFRVSERGRQRVLETKQKNVHASVVGYLTTEDSQSYVDQSNVWYNPYKTDKFLCNGSVIENVKKVAFHWDRSVTAIL